MKQLKIDELGIEELPMTELDKMHQWLKRGDGIAVYENEELGHPEMGHRKWLSFGSEESQFPESQFPDGPPERLPDNLPRGAINWRYMLVGTYRPGQDEEWNTSIPGE